MEANNFRLQWGFLPTLKPRQAGLHRKEAGGNRSCENYLMEWKNSLPTFTMIKSGNGNQAGKLSD